MPTKELQTAAEIATHSDGRPFRTAVTSPPSPGGTWPGERQETNKPKGLIRDLIRENIEDPKKRQLAAQNILDSGFLGDPVSSAEAFKIVEAAWEEIQGNSMPLETKRWLAEQRAKIAQHNQRYDELQAACLAAENSRRLHATRAKAASALADARKALAEAETIVTNAVADVESQLGEENIAGSVLRSGWRIAGAREVVAILRKIIPSREKQLAKLDTEISAVS
jgi:hypothetical protein